MSISQYKESDLFSPIKTFFEEQGFVGDGEVKTVDLLLSKADTTLAVELKKDLDFRSIHQAALDQKICDLVYIGIFRPSDLYTRSFQDRIYLLKRLGIGLICVSPRSMKVEVISEPIVSELSSFQKRNKSKKDSVIRELSSRRTKTNTGGVNKTKLVTAYKEDSLLLLYFLKQCGGQADTKTLRKLSENVKCTSIVYNNYYGWFQNVSKGIYSITPEGEKALSDFNEIIEKLIKTQA